MDAVCIRNIAISARWEVCKSMKKNEDAAVVRMHGNDGDFVWLSENAQSRMSWVLAGLMVLAMSPLFVAALLV